MSQMVNNILSPIHNNSIIITIYITAVKFNNTVSGTLQNTTEDVQADTVTVDPKNNSETTATAAISQSLPPTTPTEESQVWMRNENDNRLAFETGSPLFYGLIAAGSVIIIILLLCLISFSIFAYRRRGCKCDE